MSETALSRMRPERRAALLIAAADEFASHAFDEASLNRIIAACGLSKSSFYHVVDSKEGLFSLVVNELTAAARRVWTPPSPESFARDFWTVAEDVVTEAIEIWPASRELNLLWRIVYANPGNEAVHALSADVERWLAEVLTVGRGSGAVDAVCPAEIQTLAIISLLRAFDEWTLHQDAPEEVAVHQFRLLRRLLQA